MSPPILSLKAVLPLGKSTVRVGFLILMLVIPNPNGALGPPEYDNSIFSPDKFMFVSNWQIEQYKNIDIPKILVEYPIEYTPRPNRENALRRLNLDPSKKHILHIGLFTSRKNQKEFLHWNDSRAVAQMI